MRLARAQQTALHLAQRLASHPAVTEVRYPGLPQHPGHDLAARRLRGFGSVVSFQVSGGAEPARRVAEALQLIVWATSLGGVETTIDLRGDVPTERHLIPGLLRMSVGLEDPEDLWHDLNQALTAVAHP